MDITPRFYFFSCVVFFERFLVTACLQVPHRILVRKTNYQCTSNPSLKLLIYSICGGYGPAFAYIGEFHTEKNRSRAIIYASIILGIFTLVLPLVAWVVINQDWIIEFPSVEFSYKPWRLFIVGCSILSLVAFIILCFLPESPKFVLSHGNQAEAKEILKVVHRWNCGKADNFLHIYELYDETASLNEQFEVKKSLCASVWFQTKPLFMAPHLKTTVLLCILKFIEFAGTNGVYVWIPEMLNRLATNDIDYPGERIQMCDVVYRYRPNITYTDTSIVFAPEVRTIMVFYLIKQITTN